MPAVALAALALLLLAGVAGAVVIVPGATVRIAPSGQRIGPFDYTITLPVAGQATGSLTATVDGTATGDDRQLVASSGTVTFLNYSYVQVEIPLGTPVSAGDDPVFTTVERVIAPGGDLVPGHDPPIVPGEVSVGVVAADPGEGGNVPAGAIDTVENRRVDAYLRGFQGQNGRRVVNAEATTGGAETHRPKVEQADVDAAVTALRADLAQQLSDALAGEPDRLYPAVTQPEPEITTPKDLVGTVGDETFTLQGSLSYAQPYVDRADADDAARAALGDDPGAVPDGMSVLPGSISVTLGDGIVDGGAANVAAMVTAVAAPEVDEDLVRSLVAGKSPEVARAALASLGSATVDLWPTWLTEVTGITWRIEVHVQSAVAPLPGASGSQPIVVPSASPGS